LNLPQTSVVHGADDGAEYDITVILGADYVPPMPDETAPGDETPEAE
jgi:hypothetical protein